MNDFDLSFDDVEFLKQNPLDVEMSIKTKIHWKNPPCDETAEIQREEFESKLKSIVADLNKELRGEIDCLCMEHSGTTIGRSHTSALAKTKGETG